MDFIPFVDFVSSIIIFGLLMYVYIPVIDYLNASFPTSGIYAQAMFFIWGALAAVNLFRAGIKLIMKLQEQR